MGDTTTRIIGGIREPSPAFPLYMCARLYVNITARRVLHTYRLHVSAGCARLYVYSPSHAADLQSSLHKAQCDDNTSFLQFAPYILDFIFNINLPDFLVNPPLIKTVCILFVMLPVSSLKNIASLEKVTTVRVRGPLYRVLC